MKQQRILLVENQQTQFMKIFDKLPEYQVFPAKDDYDRFTDWVRIWVNGGYKQTRHDSAFRKIKEYVQEKGIHFFILDYKLSGSNGSLSGLGLAEELVGKCGIKHKQIILLSRTPVNSLELEPERELIAKYNWVEKGYAGMSILEDHYFNKYVKAEIDKLFNDQELEVNVQLAELRKNSTFEDGKLHDEYEVLSKIQKIGLPEEELIRKLYSHVIEKKEGIISIVQIKKYFKAYQIKKKSE
jgi:hypothetical protein